MRSLEGSTVECAVHWHKLAKRQIARPEVPFWISGATAEGIIVWKENRNQSRHTYRLRPHQAPVLYFPSFILSFRLALPSNTMPCIPLVWIRRCFLKTVYACIEKIVWCSALGAYIASEHPSPIPRAMPLAEGSQWCVKAFRKQQRHYKEKDFCFSEAGYFKEPCCM